MTARASCCSLRWNVGFAFANATSAAPMRAALLQLGARLRDAGLRVRVVEASNDLVALDALAFFDSDGYDLTRDLGGNRRRAASDDIAGRVEDRARPYGDRIRNRLCYGDLDRHRTRQPNIERRAHHENSNDQRHAPPPCGAPPRRFGRTLDPQLLDQRSLIHDDSLPPPRTPLLGHGAFSRIRASEVAARLSAWLIDVLRCDSLQGAGRSARRIRLSRGQTQQQLRLTRPGAPPATGGVGNERERLEILL